MSTTRNNNQQPNKRQRKNQHVEISDNEKELEESENENFWEERVNKLNAEYKAKGGNVMRAKSDLELAGAFDRCLTEKKKVEEIVALFKKPTKTNEDWIQILSCYVVNDEKQRYVVTAKDWIKRLGTDEDLSVLMEEQLGFKGYLKRIIGEVLYYSLSFFNGGIAVYHERMRVLAPPKETTSVLNRF